MPDFPTDAELDAMQARCDAATEGPWQNLAGDEYPLSHVPEVFSRGACQGWAADTEHHPQAKGWTPQVAEQDTANATFIAAARTDLPRLIDALREARGWIKDALDAYYMQLGSDLEKDGRRLLGKEE